MTICMVQVIKCKHFGGAENEQGTVNRQAYR